MTAEPAGEIKLMCQVVYNSKTEQEIDNCQQLQDMLGGAELVPAYKSGEIAMDCCLCQVDIEATMDKSGWKWCQPSADTMFYEVTPPEPDGETKQDPGVGG